MTLLELRFETEAGNEGLKAKDLAAVLRGFSDLVELTAPLHYGPLVRASVRVPLVKPGSSIVQTAIEISGIVANLFPIVSSGGQIVKDIGDMIKVTLDLAKHLRGDTPRNIEKELGTDNVIITNRDSQIYSVNGAIYHNCVFNEVPAKTRRLVQPLRRPGDRMTLKSKNRTLTEVQYEDIEDFRKITSPSGHIENTTTIQVRVKSPILEGRGDWSFVYGRNTIKAKIEDEEFLDKVREGLSFSAGTMMKVRMRSTQNLTSKNAKVSHVIEQVLDHNQQSRL